MSKSKGQKIKVLEKQKSTLEKQAERADMKAAFFDMMVDLAEKEYNISIRKTPSSISKAIQCRKKSE